jgi:hypothetical protein
MKRAAFFTGIYLVMVIVYILSVKNILISLPHIYAPLIAWITLIGYMLFPSKKFCNWQGRLFTFKLIGRMLFFWTAQVDFLLGWGTDQLVSFVTAFRDFEYTICFYSYTIAHGESPDQVNKKDCGENSYTIGFVAASFPIIFRMIQCFRVMLKAPHWLFNKQTVNFTKYMVSLLVAMFSFIYGHSGDKIFWVLWIIMACSSSLFSYSWDLKMDWGLLEPNAPHRFLRRTIWYKNPYFYYISGVVNLMLRFMWILSISPAILNQVWRPEFFSFLIAFIEMFRRCLWNLIRVEKEQVANSSFFKAVNELNLPYKDLNTMPLSKRELRKEIGFINKKFRLTAADKKSSLVKDHMRAFSVVETKRQSSGDLGIILGIKYLD